MDRREFSKLLAGVVAASALPAPVLAKSPLGNQQAFMAALAEKPWLLGYLGASSTELHGNVRIVSGKLPPELRGQFFRNGPAMHNIGGDRFAHWFDAPGMVQKFSFADGQVTHAGRLIETARNTAEVAAGQIGFGAFGTHGHGLSSGGSADGQSPANISLIAHAGDLLALWEGGSPHVIDPESLETKGKKVWSSETQGLPFGAHPRVDRDGSMWNIGYSADPAVLVVYHISAEGDLLKTHVLPQEATPMVHDFVLTDTKIIIAAPPYAADAGTGGAFIDRFSWQSDVSTRFLVISKDDPTYVTVLETDAFWVYHFGNAYDISATEIGFDFSHHDDPSFMTQDAFAAMDGSWDGAASAASRYVQGRLDLTGKQVHLEMAPEFGQTEFIQTDARQNLGNHRYSLMLSQPGGPEVFGFNRVVLVDRVTGNASHFDMGDTEILEEHLIVPKPARADDFWIMGTALDWRTARTSVSVYEGRHLGDGPILKAELDIPLPLGLHGMFMSAA